MEKLGYTDPRLVETPAKEKITMTAGGVRALIKICYKAGHEEGAAKVNPAPATNNPFMDLLEELCRK